MLKIYFQGYLQIIVPECLNLNILPSKTIIVFSNK